MPPDNVGHVFHAAVADLDTSPVEDLVEFVRFREVPVEESEANLSNVGTYTLTKRRVEPYDFTGSLSSLLVSTAWGLLLVYSMGWLKPLASNASLYAGAALSQDKLDILLPMPLRRCFRIAGGWLDWELMYSGGLSGFL